MSLVGRLDDLSLGDIIQIVHLSRRTGALEIVDRDGLHKMLFQRGLVVNACSPQHPDLVAYLASRGIVGPDAAKLAPQLQASRTPVGDGLVAMRLISLDALSAAVQERIVAVVEPLLASQEGVFTFRLADELTPIDIEFEPKRLFKDGGLTPQRILGNVDKDKLATLRGLEQTLKAGKALMRPASAPELNVCPAAAEAKAGSKPEDFAITEKAVEIPAAADVPNVVLFERNALLRVAAKRGFAKADLNVAQFGLIDDACTAANQLLVARRFFITILEATEDGSAERLMQSIKRRNAGLPVLIVRNQEATLPVPGGIEADLYLQKPGLDALPAAAIASELQEFADQLVLFAQHALVEWGRKTKGDPDAARRFYHRAENESLARRSDVLRNLISGLSAPDDIGEVATTILRLFEEYVDRGALFVATDHDFIGVAGFGVAGADGMNRRVAAMRVPRTAPSMLADVAGTCAPHRGKLRRTEANVGLIEAFGGMLPTEVIGLPILHEGKAIALLYGDNAEHRVPIEGVSEIEVFLFHAADAFARALYGAEMVGQAIW